MVALQKSPGLPGIDPSGQEMAFFGKISLRLQLL
jgi:hypothetical protein